MVFQQQDRRQQLLPVLGQPVRRNACVVSYVVHQNGERIIELQVSLAGSQSGKTRRTSI